MTFWVFVTRLIIGSIGIGAVLSGALLADTIRRGVLVGGSETTKPQLPRWWEYPVLAITIVFLWPIVLFMLASGYVAERGVRQSEGLRHW